MEKEYLKFNDHIKDIEEHYWEGLKRIKDYYEGRKENPSLKDPSHEILEKVATQFFLETINSCNEPKRISDPSSLYEVCIGCGTEILMKAIILLKKPDEFIKNQEMGFSKTKAILLNILPENLTDKQRERISDVLNMIKLKRDKWAHLSFHKFDAYHEAYQIFHVLEYLYQTYFPNSEVLKEIKEFKERNRVQAGTDFEPVEFD